MYVCMHSCVLMTNGLFCFAVVDVVLVGSSLKVIVVVVVKKQAMWCCWCGRWRVALVMQAFTKRYLFILHVKCTCSYRLQLINSFDLLLKFIYFLNRILY